MDTLIFSCYNLFTKNYWKKDCKGLFKWEPKMLLVVTTRRNQTSQYYTTMKANYYVPCTNDQM